MGIALTRLLQRAFPLLKEQAKTIEILQNQAVIQEQEILNLQNQRALIEQHVGELTSELTSANVKLEDLRLNSKRLVVFGGVIAFAAWLYIRKLDEELKEYQDDIGCINDDNDNDHRDVVEVPDSLECIVCMENPKEIMMEQCGHVCICRQCAETMRLPTGRVKCPVCRIRAETRTVFIS